MAKKPISHNKVNFEKAARYNPLPEKGLTSAEVKERRWNGYTNFNATVKTKSSLKIILTNALSIFNFVNILIAFALIYVGSYKNITFMGVILANLFIGIFQELRAKRATEKLSFISQAKVCVRRNGEIDDLPIDQLVLDDIIILKSGAQVVADCIILEGECEVNESFVTGESDSVYKTAGESLLSGSFVSSGECVARADKVANQTYISSISRSARTIKAPSSVLMKSLKRIITVIAIAIFPIGAMLFLGQFDQSGNDLQGAVVRTSAALLGMIPQGLMLLTSSALALSVVKLSKNKVLVKDLYCIEMLARVDTICLDKTGTLTEG
ncbi:MAG: HAD-IC family P-type ATPase, partial [Clostridia bacterium]